MLIKVGHLLNGNSVIQGSSRIVVFLPLPIQILKPSLSLFMLSDWFSFPHLCWSTFLCIPTLLFGFDRVVKYYSLSANWYMFLKKYLFAMNILLEAGCLITIYFDKGDLMDHEILWRDGFFRDPAHGCLRLLSLVSSSYLLHYLFSHPFLQTKDLAKQSHAIFMIRGISKQIE